MRINKMRMFVVAATMLASANALAVQTIGAGTNSGAAGATVTIPVTYVRPAGDGFNVFSASFRINHTNPPITFLSFTTAGGTLPTNSSVSCGANGANTLSNCSLTTNPPTAIAVGNYTLGTITYQIAAGASAGTQPLPLTVIECTDAAGDPIVGACTNAAGQITVLGGAVGPALAYNPAAGASAGTGGPVNFTGVTTVGSTGNGTISATPSGGSGGGTTTLGTFTLSGADSANFTVTNAATLTFTAGVNTPQNITATCTSGAAARTANLQATETITGGATSQRFWVLNCPAGSAVPVGPSLTYNPAAGASAGTGGPVGFTGVTTVGSTGSGSISATPSGGAASGNTTLGTFTLSGADAANFSVTNAATLTFTAGVNTPQNITATCTSGAAARTANLQATETITGGATSQRFWVLNCPAGSASPVGPSLTYNPAAGASAGTGGPVGFTGVTTVGSTGNGAISATPSGGAASGTTTLGTFTLSGADSANFSITNAATLTFTAGVNTPQNITATCTSGAAARTANLQATETITGGATSQRFWVLNCPAGSVVPVGPTPSYNPAAGASAGTGGPVNFTGVTTAGSTGNGLIAATPAGGAASGTTTLGTFTLSGANAANFTVTGAATLTFTAGVNTPQNVTLTCVSGAAARTANLQATETITGGATSQRFWVLNCPAGSAGTGATIAAGSNSGAAGTTVTIPVTYTRPAGDAFSVFSASFRINHTNPPITFVSFTTVGGTLPANASVSCGANGGNTLTNCSVTTNPPTAIAVGNYTLGTITYQIAAGAAVGPQPLPLTVIECTDAGGNPIAGACNSSNGLITVTAGGAVGPSLAYNPAAGASAGTGGPVNFTGVTTVGSTGAGSIVATPSGGSGGGTTTLGTFTLSGADAANFSVTSAATLTFTAGVNTPQNVTLTCTSGAAARTANLQATETITGGATTQRFWVLNCPAGSASPVGPSLAYSPVAGAAAGTGGPVNFTGVTTVGSTGNGLITATPSGGAGGGTTTLGTFTLSGADAANFAVTSAATLTFTAGVNTPQNVTLTCTSGAVVRTANLQATETITGGATSQRFWVLTCPAGSATPVGPNLAYNPVAGAAAGAGGPVNFTGVTTVGTTGNGSIAVTPSGGAASGTTTLGSFVLSGANAANFTVTSPVTLTFTAGVNVVQSVTLICTSGAAARTANLQATETITGGATSTRFWVLNCPAGSASPVGPAMTYTPAAGAAAGTGGPVNFTGVTTAGSVGAGQIVATPSGGAASGTTTVGNFTLSGANAASFAVTSAATLTFTAGVNTAQNINMTCTSAAGALTANLQATETVAGGATSQRFWVLNCPAGTVAAAPSVPVPALGDLSRVLLMALVLLLGLGAMGMRQRG